MIEHRFSEEIFLKEVTFRGIPTINFAVRLPESHSSSIILMDFGSSLTDRPQRNCSFQRNIMTQKDRNHTLVLQGLYRLLDKGKFCRYV